MDNKIRKINKLNYFVTSFFIIFQTVLGIYILKDFSFTYIIVHFTCWNYMICSLYLILILICDTLVFFYSYTKFEILNSFLRDILSQICFSMSIGASLFYWLFIYTSNKNNNNNQSESSNVNLSPKNNSLFNNHFHGGIILVMLIEIFFNKRKKNKFDWDIIKSIVFILLIYILVLYILKIGFNLQGFEFIKNMTFVGVIFLTLLFFICAYICYSINYCILNIVNLFNNNSIETKKDE